MRSERAAASLWGDLPFWYLWISPFILLNLEVNNLGRPALPALLSFLLPFGLVTVAFARTPGRRVRWTAYGVTSAALLVLVLGGLAGMRLERVTLLRIFEAGGLGEFFLLALHAARSGGRRVFALIFGVGLLYGLLLENAGVGMGFFSEHGYLVYLPLLPAPLCTSLGWCNVFYPLWWVVPRLAGPAARPALQTLIATGLALALDLQLDPVATAAGFWVWHPELPPAFRGVPAVNFSAWAAAVLPFSWAVFRGPAPSEISPGRLLRDLPWVLGAALLLVLLLTAATEVRLGWPSLGIFARAARHAVGWLS